MEWSYPCQHNSHTQVCQRCIEDRNGSVQCKRCYGYRYVCNLNHESICNRCTPAYRKDTGSDDSEP